MNLKRKSTTTKMFLVFGFVLFLFIYGGSNLFTKYNNKDAQQTESTAKELEAYWPKDEWRTSTPEEQGMDSKELANLVQYIEKSTGIRSLLIVRHGYLVLESYRAPYDKDTTMNVKSVSKSVLSALTGIALRENFINDIDQKVADFLPEYFKDIDPKKREITIRHLLQMTAGLPSIELDSNWEQSSDWIKYQLDLPLYCNPGESFEYSTGLTHIMSAIITKTSGMSTLEFANKYLFEPMGIEAGRWVQDPLGIYVGGNELELTPRDMAKFGYLYLHNGVWNGQQLVPAEWVEDSLTNQVRATDFNDPTREYGYWWWLGDDYYAAMGWGGQSIIVNPKLDMVVVFTGIDHGAPLQIYKNKILRAVKANHALKPNPAAVDKLNANIENLANFKSDYVSPSEELIKKINGKVFTFEKNDIGIDAVSFVFEDSTCIFKYRQIDHKGRTFDSEAVVGLNGDYQKVTESHPRYYGYDRTFFPVNEQGGDDPYTVGFEGHWIDENSFVIKCLGPLGDPLSLMAIFRFSEDKVNVNLTARPTGVHYSIDGGMFSEKNF